MQKSMLQNKCLQGFLQPDSRVFGGSRTRMFGIAVRTPGCMDGKGVELADEFHQTAGATAPHLGFGHRDAQQIILGEAAKLGAVGAP